MFDVSEAVEEVVHDEAHEQLVFRMGDMLIAIPVLLVREILDRTPYIPLPRAPHYVLGMIDVRAESIAVIDLSQRLGNGATQEHESSRIIVLELPAPGASEADDAPQAPRVLAILTDGVVAVTALDEADDQQVPEVGEEWSADFILGLGRLKEGQIVIRADLQRVFHAEHYQLFG